MTLWLKTRLSQRLQTLVLQHKSLNTYSFKRPRLMASRGFIFKNEYPKGHKQIVAYVFLDISLDLLLPISCTSSQSPA